jgi:hypothetical protein
LYADRIDELAHWLTAGTVAEAANKGSDTEATANPASQGVWKRGCSLPIGSPITLSRAIANNSRLSRTRQ